MLMRNLSLGNNQGNKNLPSPRCHLTCFYLYKRTIKCVVEAIPVFAYYFQAPLFMYQMCK